MDACCDSSYTMGYTFHSCKLLSEVLHPQFFSLVLNAELGLLARCTLNNSRLAFGNLCATAGEPSLPKHSPQSQDQQQRQPSQQSDPRPNSDDNSTCFKGDDMDGIAVAGGLAIARVVEMWQGQQR